MEIITWLDDHSRCALHCSAHRRITAPIVHATFVATTAEHGNPASTLTDNGMVYTVRFAGGRGGRTRLEVELLDITIADAVTGEILRELTLDPTKDHQPISAARPAQPTKQ